MVKNAAAVLVCGLERWCGGKNVASMIGSGVRIKVMAQLDRSDAHADWSRTQWFYWWRGGGFIPTTHVNPTEV